MHCRGRLFARVGHLPGVYVCVLLHVCACVCGYVGVSHVLGILQVHACVGARARASDARVRRGCEECVEACMRGACVQLRGSFLAGRIATLRQMCTHPLTIHPCVTTARTHAHAHTHACARAHTHTPGICASRRQRFVPVCRLGEADASLIELSGIGEDDRPVGPGSGRTASSLHSRLLDEAL